jgi:hypothetical protein
MGLLLAPLFLVGFLVWLFALTGAISPSYKELKASRCALNVLLATLSSVAAAFLVAGLLFLVNKEAYGFSMLVAVLLGPPTWLLFASYFAVRSRAKSVFSRIGSNAPVGSKLRAEAEVLSTYALGIILSVPVYVVAMFGTMPQLARILGTRLTN